MIPAKLLLRRTCAYKNPLKNGSPLLHSDFVTTLLVHRNRIFEASSVNSFIECRISAGLNGKMTNKENVFCKIPGEWINQGMAYTSSISYTCMRFLPLGLEEVRM